MIVDSRVGRGEAVSCQWQCSMVLLPLIFLDAWLLKGQCHGDFSVFWSNLLKYVTRYLFSNIKLLFEQREKI